MRTLLDDLPDLSHEARARIGEAIQTAIRPLKGISEIWHPLSLIPDGDLAEFQSQLRQSERAHLRVKIDARAHVFNAIAFEYSRVDQDPDDRCERLEQIAKRFVEQVLPLSQSHDEFLRSSLSTLVFDWSAPTLAVRSPMGSRETPAELIYRLRKKKNLTIERLASLAGVGVAQVYKIKKGADVNVRTIRSVAAVLGCHPGDLILPIPISNERGAVKFDDLPPKKRDSPSGKESDRWQAKP